MNKPDRYPEGHSSKYWKKHPEALKAALASNANLQEVSATLESVDTQRPKDVEGFKPKDITSLAVGILVGIALWLAAPKVGRGATAIGLSLIFFLALYPVWQYSLSFAGKRKLLLLVFGSFVLAGGALNPTSKK